MVSKMANELNSITTGNTELPADHHSHDHTVVDPDADEDHDIFAHLNDSTSIETLELEQSNVSMDSSDTRNAADVIEEVLIETVDSHIVSVPAFTAANAALSVPVDQNEHDELIQEDEVGRVLTTLESKAKSPHENDVVQDVIVQEVEDYMEVVEETVAAAPTTTELDSNDPGELARRQLQKIEQTKRSHRTQKSNGDSASTSSEPNNLILNMKHQLAQKFVAPHKPNAKSATSGTIEIPKELISGPDDLNSSVLLKSETPLKREDLLAILEGSDDDSKANKKAALTDKEYEKQLALKQMLSLPPKPKGRRPNAAKQLAKQNNDLVSSLVKDWSGGSDSESKTEDEPKQQPKKVKVLKKKSPSVKAPSPDAPTTFKRSRIIKKKIIWDPDAPETAISYASLIQPSAAFNKKAQSANVVKKAEPAQRILNKIATQTDSAEKPKDVAPKKRAVSTPSPTTVKKRKISEIDRLLGDEGAVNMLNALKQENNNADMPENESSSDDVQKTGSSPDTISDDKSNSRPARAKRPQTPQKTVQPVAKKEPAKRKKAAAVGSKSWDYIYSNRDDDSLIIRRRSNSSYSSSASNTRLSIDTPSSTKSAKSAKVSTKGAKAKALARSKESTSFEFAKPNARKSAQNEEASVESTILMDIRPKPGHLSPAEASGRRSSNAASDAKEKRTITRGETTITAVSKQKVVPKPKNVYQEIRIERDEHVAHIILEPFTDKLANVFTLQLMREVCKALLSLDDDATCKVVLISSATATFCNGIDYSSLVQSSQDKRRSAAAELSSEVGKFIESLASFRKTLIAGVHGHVVGIGVTILPLFDLVLANANTTFETPYARIGQIPEGCSVLLLSNKVNQNAKTELLVLGETLDAASAHGHSLVTKVIHTNGFEAELQRQVSLVAQLSVQALEATKAVIHTAELAALPVRLADELKVLQQHWMSTECQYNIKQYILTNKW